MMRNKRFSLKKYTTLFILSTFSMTQAHAIGLLQAYQEALKHDALYLAAQADNQAGQQYSAIGRSGLLPSLQYSYSTSKNKGESIAPDFFGKPKLSDVDYRSTSKGFNLRQALYSRDAFARFQQGVVQTKLSNAQFDSRSRDLMVRVVSAYSDAKYAEDQLSLYTAQRDAYAEQMQVNRRMFEKGEGTRTDMLETQAKLDVANAMVIEFSDNAVIAKNTLASMIGMEVNSLDGLSNQFQPLSLGLDHFDEWKEVALNENADIAASKLSLEAAELEIKKSLAGHFPRLDLNASYNSGLSETLTTRNQDNHIRSVGVQLVIPIYSGGYTNAVSKQAVANRDRAKAELEATINKVTLELRKQFGAMKNNVLKIEALQKSVESSSLLVEATKQSIQGGVRINADLLNAQQQLVATKRDLASARYSYLISYLRLRVAAGNLHESDLRTVAAYFVSQ